MKVLEAQSTAAVITAGLIASRSGPLAADPNDSDIRALVTRGGPPKFDVAARRRGETSVEIISGKGRLLDEPGALDEVWALAARWFSEHLRKPATIAA